MSEVDPARTPPTRRRLVLVMTLVVIACFSLQIALDLASSFWRVSETSVSIAYRPPAAAFDLVAAQERAEQARQAGPVISRMGTLALAWREADTEFPDCGARFVRATLTASVTVWQTHELHGELPRIAAAAGLDAPCSGVSVRVAGIDRGASMLNGGSLLALILLVLMWRSHRGRHWLRNWLDWQPRIDRKWAVAWGVGGFVAIEAAMIAAAIVRELAGVPHEPRGMHIAGYFPGNEHNRAGRHGPPSLIFWTICTASLSALTAWRPPTRGASRSRTHSTKDESSRSRGSSFSMGTACFSMRAPALRYISPDWAR